MDLKTGPLFEIATFPGFMMCSPDRLMAAALSTSIGAGISVSPI